MTRVFAHRGCTADHPENTLAAFARAGAVGAHGVELDVRLTADGMPVVVHDADLPGLGPVADLPADRVPPVVPFLGPALDACRGLVVNIELKGGPEPAGGGPRSPARRLAGVVASLLEDRGRGDRVVVSSFSAALVEAVRAADPALEVAWLLSPAGDARTGLERAIERGYHGVHPFVTQVNAGLVDRARAAGLAVRAWTVNAPADLHAMVDLGVDAVITDRPEEALAIAAAG